MNTGLVMGAVAASVTFAVVATALVVRPLRRLGPRIRPYTAATRVEAVREEGGERLVDLSVTTTNQKGETVLTGTATAVASG